MAANEIPVVNVGEFLRDGSRLKTVEAVAIVHAICVELDAGTAVAVPSSPDNVAVTDTGRVKLFHGADERQPTRLAVATLLEELLDSDTEEPANVPSALRTLPTRLRAVGDRNNKSDVKDLLSILRWHLPRDSREVLQDLFVRARLSEAGSEDDVVETFAGERLQDDEVDLVLRPERAEAIVTAPPSSRRRLSPAWAYATAALLAFFIAGYAGYQFVGSWRALPSSRPSTLGDSSPSTVSESTAAAPRVVPRKSPAEPRPIALAVSGGAFSPSFTAEARTLLFHAGRNSTGRLFTATLDDRGRASALTPLFEDAARNYHARPSPDGRWIAFDSDRQGERGVFIADRDGKQIERVSGDGFAAVPSWSPDMRTLAFVRAEPGRPRVWNLWMRDLPTGRLSRATRFGSGQVWGASWFADSASYAFSHEDRLIIADRTGQQLTSFASPVAGRLVRTPAVSPDGREIVFQVYRDGVWIVDVTSAAMRRILDDVTAEEFTWSPDGAQIAYHSRRDGEWRIWVMTP
jgi:Tol biopolymer transport system component